MSFSFFAGCVPTMVMDDVMIGVNVNANVNGGVRLGERWAFCKETARKCNESGYAA